MDMSQFQSLSSNESTEKNLDTNNSNSVIEEGEEGNPLKKMKYIETANVPVPQTIPDWLPIPVTEPSNYCDLPVLDSPTRQNILHSSDNIVTMKCSSETANVHHDTKSDNSTLLGSKNLELINIIKNVNRNNDCDNFGRLDCISSENTNNSNSAIEETEEGNPLKQMNYIDTANVPVSQTIPDWLPIPVTEPSNYCDLPMLDSPTCQNILHSSDNIVIMNRNQFQSIYDELKNLRQLVYLNQETNKKELSEIKYMVWKQNFNRQFPALPAKNPGDIFIMENELKNEESYQLMITHLHHCCRRTLNNTVKFILDKVMSNDCAVFYRRDQFSTFKRLQIFKIIIDVSVAVHPNKTKAFAVKLIRKWIQLKSTTIETYVRGQHMQCSPVEDSVPSNINIKQEPLSPDEQEPGTSFEYN